MYHKRHYKSDVEMFTQQKKEEVLVNELFYSKDNMERIEKSVQQIREGKVVRKTIEELEVMENYWFHQKDTPMDMVEIEIQTHKLIDQDTISEEWIEKLMYRGREVRRKGNSDGYNE